MRAIVVSVVLLVSTFGSAAPGRHPCRVNLVLGVPRAACVHGGSWV